MAPLSQDGCGAAPHYEGIAHLMCWQRSDMRECRPLDSCAVCVASTCGNAFIAVMQKRGRSCLLPPVCYLVSVDLVLEVRRL